MDIGFIISLSSSNAPNNLNKVKDIVQEIFQKFGTDKNKFTAIKLVDSKSVRDVAREAETFKQYFPKGVDIIITSSEGMQLVDAIDDAKKTFEKV